MDAYQYFYNAGNTASQYRPVGEMEWDARRHHKHWHFSDFANYRLVDGDGRSVIDGGKQAWCIANTDIIDLTVSHAVPHPEISELSTVCGEETSLGLRESLEVGSGDTYDYTKDGQSFDVADVPDGVYWLEVSTNPHRRLYEDVVSNNVVKRRLRLRTIAGRRAVVVPPYGQIAR